MMLMIRYKNFFFLLSFNLFRCARYLACSWKTRPCPTDSNRCSNQCFTMYAWMNDYMKSMKIGFFSLLHLYLYCCYGSCQSGCKFECDSVENATTRTFECRNASAVYDKLWARTRWIAGTERRTFTCVSLLRMTRYGSFTVCRRSIGFFRIQYNEFFVELDTEWKNGSWNFSSTKNIKTSRFIFLRIVKDTVH